VDLAARLRLLQRTLGSQADRLDVVTEVMRGAHESVESRRVAEYVVARMAGWLALPSWSVWVLDPTPRRPILLATTRALDGSQRNLARMAGTIIHQARDLSVASLRELRTGGLGGAAVGFVLLARGQAVGALVGVDASPSADAPRLGPAARERLARLLDPMALALDNARRVEAAEQAAVTDDLTQLYNGRFLTEVLRRELKRALRTGAPLSLLFLDFDNFKQVNDTSGHLVGSRALVEFARLARRSTRESDTIARFGGDEFAVVLPDTDLEGAVIVAERIRERVASHRFGSGRTRGLRLTVSIGVAASSRRLATPSALLKAGDHAMYEAKRLGGNRVRRAPDVDKAGRATSRRRPAARRNRTRRTD
jgi:diguanylate cyclase (GGDEF)-like protein